MLLLQGTLLLMPLLPTTARVSNLVHCTSVFGFLVQFSSVQFSPPPLAMRSRTALRMSFGFPTACIMLIYAMPAG